MAFPLDAFRNSSSIPFMTSSRTPKGLARMAGRMWLGAPALAVLFTYGVAEAAARSPEALVSQPESATPAWAALPAIAERLSAGIAQHNSTHFVHRDANVQHAAFWLADSSLDRRVLECLNASHAVAAPISNNTNKVETVEVASLHRDPGHTSPPIAAP